MCVWIALKTSKQNTFPRIYPQEAINFLSWYTLTYVVLLMLHLLVVKKYFITFITYFSQYCYLYLLHKKLKHMCTLYNAWYTTTKWCSWKTKLYSYENG